MATATTSIPESSRIPLWLKLVLCLLAVVVVAAFAVPYSLNVDRYRDALIGIVAKETGRTVTLGGIHARLFPRAGVSVAGLHIGNPDGFPPGDLLSSDEIRINVSFAPLLHGIIHVQSVDLVHPRLTLLTGASGKNNYTFETSGEAARPADSAQPGELPSGITLDQVDTIRLTGAEVAVGTVVNGEAAYLANTKGINVTLHNFGVNPLRPREWKTESNLAGATLALSGWKAPISFRAGQATLSDGKLDAQFAADLASAGEIRGTFEVLNFERPQVSFEMSAAKLDVDTLFDVAGSGPGLRGGADHAPANLGAAAAPAAAASPLDKSDLVAHGHINVEQVVTSPYTVGPANVEMRIYTDRAELWPISIGMYGGTLQISSRVDRVTDPARFTANVQMRNLDVEKVLEVSPSARGRMAGTGELDLQLLGNLSKDWKKTLSGTGKFAVRNGHLPGVNLAGASGSMAKLAGVDADTPFNALTGDIAIAEQRVASKQIHLDSAVGTADLKGSLGLDGTLDYEGSAIVNPAAALGKMGGVLGGLLGSRSVKVTVPFALLGTIEEPKFRPQITAAPRPPNQSPPGTPPARPRAPDEGPVKDPATTN